MNSKRLFVVGYVLLVSSLGLGLLVFGLSPMTVFSLPKGTEPGGILLMDAIPTIVFFVGVGFLVAAQLKQRSESLEDV